jgi:hypothetical protein
MLLQAFRIIRSSFFAALVFVDVFFLLFFFFLGRPRPRRDRRDLPRAAVNCLSTRVLENILRV